MAATPVSVRAVVIELTERTKLCSKADIKRWIKESESNVVSLESQIAALEELLARELATVEALQYIISPIHALPNELLVEIFALAIRDQITSSPRPFHHSTTQTFTHIKDVLRISQVCSDWRQIAHGTPQLWTRPIEVVLDGRDSAELYANCLKAWLARSQPLPVSISLTSRRWNNASPRITEEVLRTAPRWRSFQADSRCTWASFIKQVAECRLDSLEKLGLGLIKRDVSDLEPILFSAPCLQNVRMSLDPDSQQIFMPWAQLTDLTLDKNYTPDIALDILGQCTGLVKASVTSTGWPQLPQANTKFLTLNHLRILFLTFFGTTYFMPFLDRLSVPALEELGLDCRDMYHTQAWTEAHFTAFQQRSPHVTRLELTHSNLTSGDLIAALRHAPCLTHLKLISCGRFFDDALIDALYFKNGAVPLAPRLHNLIATELNRNMFTENILADMIASRWWADAEVALRPAPSAVARWTSVYVKLEGFFTQFSQQFLDSVDDLRQKGLDILRCPTIS